MNRDPPAAVEARANTGLNSGDVFSSPPVAVGKGLRHVCHRARWRPAAEVSARRHTRRAIGGVHVVHVLHGVLDTDGQRFAVEDVGGEHLELVGV